jgi:hypothetical protein
MRLPEVQSRQLLREQGVYATEICDKCGKILGHVRFTRSGDAGAWCSRLRRDGVEHEAGVCRAYGTSLNGKRRGSLYCSPSCKMRVSRNSVSDSHNNGNAPIQNNRLIGAIFESGYARSLEVRKSPSGAGNAF